MNNLQPRFTSPFEEATHRAKVQLIQSELVKNYRFKLQDETLRSQLPADLQHLIRVYEQNKQLSQSRDSEVIKEYLLTINPPDNYNWVSLKPLVTKLLSYRDFLIDPLISWEQRSENVDNPYGWHVHIACKLGRSSTNTIDTVYKQVHKFLGSDCNRACIDLKKTPNAYEYVSGSKRDEDGSKTNKMKVDKIQRELQGFTDDLKL